MKKSISENVCESCIKVKQQQKSFKKLQLKANIILKKIYVNI